AEVAGRGVLARGRRRADEEAIVVAAVHPAELAVEAPGWALSEDVLGGDLGAGDLAVAPVGPDGHAGGEAAALPGVDERRGGLAGGRRRRRSLVVRFPDGVDGEGGEQGRPPDHDQPPEQPGPACSHRRRPYAMLGAPFARPSSHAPPPP